MRTLSNPDLNGQFQQQPQQDDLTTRPHQSADRLGVAHAARPGKNPSPGRPPRTSPSTLVSKTLPRTRRITATTTASRQGTRPPLAFRDQNEKLSSLLSNVDPMPPNDRSQRPSMPTLASSAQKAAGKAPLTPKIAPKVAALPSVNTPNSTTPLPRRSRRPDSVYPADGTPSSSRDDVTTPVSSFLGTNVTPRSGSRQSRVESNHSTPVGTPTAERSAAYDPDSKGAGPGIAFLGPENEMPRRTVVSFSPAPAALSSLALDRPDLDSKFVYASDANVKVKKEPQQQQQSARPSVPGYKAPAFFHASDAGKSRPISTPGDLTGRRSRGASSSDRPTSTPTSVLSPAVGSPVPLQDHFSSKFVYANGTPDVDDKRNFSPPSSTTISTSSVTAARSANTTPGIPHGASRPVSPIKAAQTTAFTAHNNGSLPTLATRCPPLGPAASPNPGLARVNPAGDTPQPQRPQLGHARTGSIPTVEQIIALSRLLPSALSSECSTPASPGAYAMPNQDPTSAGEYCSDSEDADTGLQSPASPSSSKPKTKRDELVANARNERKVQDLEITNASLAAINRTLERQLRKQQAELRRYRRLSRAGRLAPSAASPSRMPLETFSIRTTDADDLEPSALSEVDEEQPEEEEEEEEEDNESSDENESELTPGELAIRDAKHLEKDEKRLQLDLSKHQQLLIDSQKINQSLKRCLSWSEMMIKEGKRALAYNVRVSDVEIGGRILPPPDEEDETDDGILMDEMSAYDEDEGTEDLDSTSQLSADRLSVEPEVWAKVPQDRDSGIDLAPDGG